MLLRLANTLLGASEKDIESYIAHGGGDERSMAQLTTLLEQYVQLRGAYRDGERMMNDAIERILGVIGRYVDDEKARPRTAPRGGARKTNPGL
jgi:hypothetical protein